MKPFAKLVKQYSCCGMLLLGTLTSLMAQLPDLKAQSPRLKAEFLTTYEGLKENRVQYLLEDRDGMVIIIGGEFFNTWEGSSFRYFGAPDSYNFFIQDDSGNIIASTWNDLYVITDRLQNKFKRIPVPKSKGRCPFTIDTHQRIWIGTPQGYVYEYQYNSDTIRYIRELKSIPDTEGPGAVHAVYLQDSATLWLGCETGLYRYELCGEEVLKPCLIKELNDAGGAITVHSIFPDNGGMLWVGTQKGIRLIDPENMVQENVSCTITDLVPVKFPELSRLKDETVYAIQSDRHEELFFRSGKAIYFFNQRTRELSLLYREDIDRYDDFSGYAQYSLSYMDEGLLWFCTDHGAGKLNLNHRAFQIYQHDPEDPYSLNDNSLNQVVRDYSGNLWVGTTGKGLNCGVPGQTGTAYRFEHFTHDPEDPESLHTNTVSHLFVDSRGRVWVGAGSIQQVIRKNGKVRFIYPEFIWKFSGCNTPDRVIDISEDTLGNIWLGCIGSSFIFNPETGYWSRFYLTEDKKPLEYNYLFVTSDKQHYALCFYSGFYKINFPLRQLDSISVCPASVEMILDSSLFQVLQDVTSEVFESAATKELWTASYSQYIFGETGRGPEVKRVRTYTHDDGIPWDYSYTRVRDNFGRMWMAGENGLCCIDPSTEKLMTLRKEDGLPTNSFYYGAYKDKDGRLFFPSREGLVSFLPEDITFPEAHRVILKDLIISQKIRRKNKKHSISPDIIRYPAQNIRLPFYQNSISIDYTAPDYVDASAVRYAWTLQDLQGKLEITGAEPRAVFVDLRPGKYQFSVKAANHNNVWTKESANLYIRILPPLWLTWYAYILYALIFLAIILLYRRFLLRRARLKTALEVERVEKEKVVELDHLKSRFFANISHEFRTPLTLILGPIEELAKSPDDQPRLGRDTLLMIRRNIKRLQRLINQLLDVARLESGTMTLCVVPDYLNSFCRTLSQSFISLAESKHITYECDLEEQAVPVFFDADKLEKILSNLIANAFKFTPEGGSIKVSLTFPEKDKRGSPVKALFSISDTGKGIPSDQLDKIFNRFYQVEASDRRGEEGTGIGLSLTRELVELHRGEIHVDSKTGKGSRFIVSLPVARECYKPEEIGSVRSDLAENEALLIKEEVPITVHTVVDFQKTSHSEKQDGKPLVLLAEDNTDLRRYIRSLLSEFYRLEEARDGRSGIELAREHIPDLIVTDLMMPVMDGLEMCRILKTDEKTSHIPIIMLTARADRESKLTGLKHGADDYLIKPFDADELKVRVKNLIRQRQVLREKFRKEFFSVSSDENYKPYDDELLDKLTRLFESHIADPDFDIMQLCDELNMSRTQLFRKIHALTGHAPKELLRDMRIRSAARMFLSGHEQITQVMFRVGFSNSSWFTKCFREVYGLTPTDYIKKHSGSDVN